MNNSSEGLGDLNHLFKLELGFYEVMHAIAKRTKVFFTVPETFVQGFGFGQPTLLCTDYETGELLVREDITRGGLLEAFAFFEDLNKMKGNIPVAVHKLAATTYCKDTCRAVFNSQDATALWTAHETQGHAQLMQRYVSGLAKRPAVLRATWESGKVSKTLISAPVQRQKTASKSYELQEVSRKAASRQGVYLISTKSESAVKSDLPVAHAIDSKVLYLVTLLEKYYLPSPDLKIYSLEADFVQDEKGLCYMINMKSFRLSKHLGYEPERPPKACLKVKKRRSSQENSSKLEERIPSLPRIPKIKHWNRAILSHKRIVAVQEEKERAKLNKTMGI